MAKYSRSVKTAANLFVLLLFVLVAFIAGRTVERNDASDMMTSGDPIDSRPSPSITIIEENGPVATENPSSETSSVAATPSLLLIEERKGGATRLVTIDPETAERHVIFTDSDETTKIKQLGGVTATGAEVLAVLGKSEDAFGGDLYTIATNGTGTATLLATGHVSPEAPAIRPDGLEIAFVVFGTDSTASVAGSGQFSLTVSDRGKTTERTLVQSSRTLTRPTYMSNQKLAYITEAADGTSGIYELDVTKETPTPHLVVNLPDMTPYDLTYRAGRFAFINGVGSAAALFEYDVDTGKVMELAHPAGPETSPLYASSGSVLYFGNGEGEAAAIYRYTLHTGTADKVSSGLRPLGWVPQGEEV